MNELYERYLKEFKVIEKELLATKQPWQYYNLAVLYEIVMLLDTELESVAELQGYFERHHLRDFMDVGDDICEGDDALHWQIQQWLESDYASEKVGEEYEQD